MCTSNQPCRQFVQPALLIQLPLFFADIFQIVHARMQILGQEYPQLLEHSPRLRGMLRLIPSCAAPGSNRAAFHC